MSSPLLVYLLLVCLSLHACNARYLGFVGKETKKQPFSKDAEVAILNMPSILSKVLPQKFDLLSVHRVLVGASTMKQLKDEEPTKASLSGHNLIVSSPYDLKHATKIQNSYDFGCGSNQDSWPIFWTMSLVDGMANGLRMHASSKTRRLSQELYNTMSYVMVYLMKSALEQIFVPLEHKLRKGGSKKKGRWMLGSEANDAKEAIESKGNEIVEDIEEMDYAQPHRKPPIHNLKP